MTREQVLKETVEFYNLGNRAIQGDNCYYITNCGNKCAVGRLLTDKECHRIENFSITGIGDFYASEFEEYLPEKVAELGQEFLGKLQELHDWANNWTETGISKEGIEVANNIIKRFKLELPEFKMEL